MLIVKFNDEDPEIKTDEYNRALDWGWRKSWCFRLSEYMGFSTQLVIRSRNLCDKWFEVEFYNNLNQEGVDHPGIYISFILLKSLFFELEVSDRRHGDIIAAQKDGFKKNPEYRFYYLFANKATMVPGTYQIEISWDDGVSAKVDLSNFIACDTDYSMLCDLVLFQTGELDSYGCSVKWTYGKEDEKVFISIRQYQLRQMAEEQQVVY
jgi:hypothetical protein